MDTRQIILAVAGAGKTYFICKNIDPLKKNLILAYTHENTRNINKELISAYGSIPHCTTVMTFDAFVYRHMIRPYEPSIREYFGRPEFVSTGVSTLSPPKPSIVRGNVRISNPRYSTKDTLDHYITKAGQYYCATLSELVLQVSSRKGPAPSLINRIANRLMLAYDYIAIDEFQDFRENNYELLIRLSKRLKNVVMVGDFYQHSVSGLNNSGKPYAIRKRSILYEEFKESLEKSGFKVDDEMLMTSRRCSPDVCNFVSQKLGIQIKSFGDNEGKVVWCGMDSEGILKDDSIPKLVYMNSSQRIFRAINWSYSKGDTLDSVCVILTKNMEDLDDENFNWTTLSPQTRNKLYVALTRSRGNVYLMKESIFNKLIKQLSAHEKSGGMKS